MISATLITVGLLATSQIFTTVENPFGANMIGQQVPEATPGEYVPRVIGTMPGGLVANYGEAHRMALEGKLDLVVLVGVSGDLEAEMQAASFTDPDTIYAVATPGDGFTRGPGVYRYRYRNGRLLGDSPTGQPAGQQPKTQQKTTRQVNCSGGFCRVK